jgi:hypothetical protein
MQLLSSQDAAYIAGLIDGEGCIYAGLTRNGLLAQITVYNANKSYLEAVRAMVGLGGSIRSGVPKSSKHKRVWRWTLGRKAGERLLTQCLKYLIAKHEQAILWLDLDNGTVEKIARLNQLNHRGLVLADSVELPKKGMPRNFTDDESAYLCGIVDGEGSFCLTHKKGRMTNRRIWQKPGIECRLRVSNTSKPLIRFLAGLGVGRCSASVRSAKWRPEYTWCVGKRELLPLLPRLKYLRLKADRAALVSRHLTKNDHSAIEKLVELNTKGPV